MDLSIIIPYWKREEQIGLIICSLARQMPDNIQAEILICDSYSGGGIGEIISRAKLNFDNILIRHIQCENIVSQKRNVGIKQSTGDKLIFLDDDCVPRDNFIKKVLSDMGTIHDGVLCGEVRFPEHLINASNYYRYRDSKHQKFLSDPFKDIDQWSFVSMNMVVKRTQLLDSSILYDERFIGYGCEDHEFPWKLLKKNIKIRMGSFCIEHHEYNGDISKYKRKIFCTARDGMYVLSKIAPEIIRSHKKLNFIESIYSGKYNLSLIFRFIGIIFFNKYLSDVAEMLLKKSDGNKKMYFPSIFRYVLLCAYLSGVKSRDNKLKNIGKDWYV